MQVFDFGECVCSNISRRRVRSPKLLDSSSDRDDSSRPCRDMYDKHNAIERGYDPLQYIRLVAKD